MQQCWVNREPVLSVQSDLCSKDSQFESLLRNWLSSLGFYGISQSSPRFCEYWLIPNLPNFISADATYRQRLLQ